MFTTSASGIRLVEDNARDAEWALDALAEHNVANEIRHWRVGADARDSLYWRGEFAGRTNGQPAVIMLDRKMRRVDGIEVLGQIKGDPALKRIPVGIMTSSREESDLTQSEQLGGNAPGVKPVRFIKFVGRSNGGWDSGPCSTSRRSAACAPGPARGSNQT